MSGDVGAVATLLNTVAQWVMSEDGYAQWQRRRELERARNRVLAVLKVKKDEPLDLVELDAAIRDLERLSKRA